MVFEDAPSTNVPTLLTPEAAERLLEQRDSVVLRDKLRKLSMVDHSGPEELLESLDSANRLATEAYHRSHMLSARSRRSDAQQRLPDWSYLRRPMEDPSRTYHTHYRPLSASSTIRTASSGVTAAGPYAAHYRGLATDRRYDKGRITAADLGATSVSCYSSTASSSPRSVTPSSWESVSLVMGDDVDNTIGNSIAYRDTMTSSSSPALLPPSRRSRAKVMDSSPSSSALYERHGAWMMKREQRLEERRREKEEDSMRECKFKPKTSAQRRGTQTRIGPQQVKEWEQRRKEREREAEEAREEKEIAACTFTPDIGKSQRMRQGSSRLFEATRQQGSSSSSPPQRGPSEFTPATNTVRRSMRHAREYMETNVFDRLASHGRRRVSCGRGYDMPSRKAETRLSEVQMQTIMHSFLTRQNEREARRQEKLGMLEREVRADCTHEPKICDRSRRVSVPKVTERIRSKHSESREGMLRELEISRPFVPVVTAKARRARSRTVVEMSYDDMSRRRESIARLARTLKDRKEAEEERRRSVNSITRVPGGPLKEIPSRLRLDVERGSDYLRRVAEERERRAEAQRLRQLEIEAEELAQCTFRPSINKAPHNGEGRERLSVTAGVKRGSYGGVMKPHET